MRVIVNKIMCNHCQGVIESFHRHDFKFCSCGRVSVDGGLDYVKRSCDSLDDYEELSVYALTHAELMELKAAGEID